MDFYGREHARMQEPRASRSVIGENITTLMGARADLSSNAKLSEQTSLGTGTIARIRNGDVGCTVDTLDVLAKAFGVQAWQLVVPGFDPRAMPVLQAATPAERDLYDKIKALIQQNDSRA